MWTGQTCSPGASLHLTRTFSTYSSNVTQPAVGTANFEPPYWTTTAISGNSNECPEYFWLSAIGESSHWQFVQSSLHVHCAAQAHKPLGVNAVV